jgi:hypothetical protein
MDNQCELSCRYIKLVRNLPLWYIYKNTDFPLTYCGGNMTNKKYKKILILYLISTGSKFDDIITKGDNGCCHYLCDHNTEEYVISFTNPIIDEIKILYNEAFFIIDYVSHCCLNKTCLSIMNSVAEKNIITIGREIIYKVFLFNYALQFNDILCVITEYLFRIL